LGRETASLSPEVVAPNLVASTPAGRRRLPAASGIRLGQVSNSPFRFPTVLLIRTVETKTISNRYPAPAALPGGSRFKLG